MQYREYTTIDRTGWPAGPWDGEPDKVQWQDEETGLPCLAVRHGHFGHWCGYVGVSDKHPLHGKDYEIPDVSIHGGLTFADICQPTETEATGICHVPAAGEPDHVWWFGFDCAHCYDYSPRDKAHERDRGEWFWKVGHDREYRTLDYVREECRNLARQLAALAKATGSGE